MSWLWGEDKKKKKQITSVDDTATDAPPGFSDSGSSDAFFDAKAAGFGDDPDATSGFDSFQSELDAVDASAADPFAASSSSSSSSTLAPSFDRPPPPPRVGELPGTAGGSTDPTTAPGQQQKPPIRIRMNNTTCAIMGVSNLLRGAQLGAGLYVRVAMC